MAELFKKPGGPNTGPHFVARIQKIRENWTVVVDHYSDKRPYRNDYYMAGSTLIFPKGWGMKRGALELLRQRIAMDEATVSEALQSISEMQAVVERITQWPDDIPTGGNREVNLIDQKL